MTPEEFESLDKSLFIDIEILIKELQKMSMDRNQQWPSCNHGLYVVLAVVAPCDTCHVSLMLVSPEDVLVLFTNLHAERSLSDRRDPA